MSSIYDYEDAFRAGAARGRQIGKGTSAAAITSQFSVWWNYEKGTVDPPDKAGNKRAYMRGWRASIKNPMPVGRKVKGGRAVSVKNFTGTITRKNDGTVIIRGRKR